MSATVCHRLHQPWHILYELKLMLISASAMYVADQKLLASFFMAGLLVHISLVMLGMSRKPPKLMAAA